MEKLLLNIIIGTTSVGTMAAGIMAGGYIIKRFKPKPKSLVLWMYSVELVPMIAIFAGMFLGCDVSSFAETAIGNDGRFDAINIKLYIYLTLTHINLLQDDTRITQYV